MEPLPALPSAGPLRVVVIAGTVALLAYGVAAAAELARRRWPRLRWTIAVVVLAVASVVFGALGSLLHAPAIALTFLVAARNAVRLEGVARAATVIGLVSWAVSGLAARALFGS